ncbi:MAG: flavin reductase family protein [Candidatus Promineofilum sp.]|nr:flavin reductase family protein [Promineifilum sp.]
MILHVDEITHHDRYRLVIGSIVPRPIAWVSTMDAAGRLNLAPFSYFNAVCPSPMTLVFCPGVHSDGRKKDSWRNIEEVPEFVINITNEDTAEPMNLCATLLPTGESEFDWAGVTPTPSETIRVPRVAEAPIAFECVLDRIITISDQPGGGAAIFGRVQCVHVRDDIYDDGRIDTAALRPIGRLAGDAYTRATDIFHMKRVPREDR